MNLFRQKKGKAPGTVCCFEGHIWGMHKTSTKTYYSTALRIPAKVFNFFLIGVFHFEGHKIQHKMALRHG